MGLGASQARLLMLTARRSDLELQLQFINQARMQIANMVTALIGPTQNLDPEASAGLQTRIAAIQQQDKVLEMQAQRINTQHEAVGTEIQAVQKVIQKNIAMSFKLMG